MAACPHSGPKSLPFTSIHHSFYLSLRDPAVGCKHCTAMQLSRTLLCGASLAKRVHAASYNNQSTQPKHHF